MLNHQLRPTGSAPFPEANVASSSHTKKPERERRRGRGRGRVAVEVVDVEEKVMMVERRSVQGITTSQNKDTETNFISDEPGPSFDGLSDDFHLDVPTISLILKNQLSQRKSNR
ncbi:unnamed protein product [Microthlaspi erraticum]|uniref:Uncharacterized protein n=1 Tax=Microthlaspi erraticum TaxID=1685480 RepID=A0A6D2KX13_9BRAS|nr:unnamed protein product [Microthlaspi erraticum]